MIDLTKLRRGDVVGVKHPKHPGLDCAITSTRHIQRGRRAGRVEYKLAPIGNTKGAYGFTTVGTTYFIQLHQKHTAAEIKAAIGDSQETYAKVAERKHETASRGCNALIANDIQPGDKVKVKWKDGDQWEVVGKISFSTGKVAILRANTAEILAAKRNRQATELDMILDGMGLGARKRRGRQPYRWIHMDHIIDVEKTKEVS